MFNFPWLVKLTMITQSLKFLQSSKAPCPKYLEEFQGIPQLEPWEPKARMWGAVE